MLGGIHGKELHAEVYPLAIGGEDATEETFYLLRPMDVQTGCTTQESHGADETRQTKHVIAMVVGDEDVSDACHSQPHALHLHLCSFAAVYHEVLRAEIHNLCCGHVSECGLG